MSLASIIPFPVLSLEKPCEQWLVLEVDSDQNQPQAICEDLIESLLKLDWQSVDPKIKVISVIYAVDDALIDTKAIVVSFELNSDHSVATTPLFLTAKADFQPSLIPQSLLQSDNLFVELAKYAKASVLRLDQPLVLHTVHIPKPWGQEIWYTGVEERGICRVGPAEGSEQNSLPLNWLLSLFPQSFSAGQDQLVLLKILDPRPEPVYGDLYFELHERKQEVYVVTNIDKNAWPDGEGGIRFGFCPKKRAQYASDDAFLADYEQAVNAYRQVRVEIDALYDQKRLSEGFGLNDALGYEVIAPWEAELPESLREQESQLRAQMQSFTHLKSLKLGDVVKVPCFLPHSLQHGVRTIEFQTPVYERKILSFAQKVLTQDHWDTQDALKLASVKPAQDSDLAVLSETDALKQESVVEFDDFSVKRLTLSAKSQIELPNDAYTLVIGIEQTLQCDGLAVNPEQAVMIPSCKSAFLVENKAQSQAIFLIASPAS